MHIKNKESEEMHLKNKESEEMPNGGCVGEIMGDFIQILLYITNFNEINLKLNSK
jgi:hypothetical protein